jgi:hypothetical protein
MKQLITIKDRNTGEVLAVAPLSKTRCTAILKAYSKAGIEAVTA